MSETPKKSDKQSKRDARLKTFLRRAGPVIAAERGLTSTARIKLQTIAAEMRLPGELLEEALTELQTETQKRRQYTRWERGFAKYLASQLKKLDNRILTFEREQKAIQVAEEKYQLDHPQAQEIISEVAKQLEIRRISASEAERHVETTVKEKVGQGIWIDLESRERLYMLGEEWGLSKEHVAAVIDHYIRSNKDRKSVEQRRSSLFVAAIGVVFLGLLATTLYLGVQYSLNPESSEQNKGNEDEGFGGRIGQFEPPTWWTDRLSTSVATAIGGVPDFQAYVGELASTDSSTRESGYQNLVASWLGSFEQRETHNRLQAVLRDCLVLEPDSEISQRIFDSIIQSARPPQNGLPSGGDFYRHGMKLIEFGCRLLDQDNLQESQKDAFQEQLDQVTGTFLTTLPGGTETIERYQADYLQRLFDHLIEYAAGDPSLSLDRFDQLRKVASSLVSDGEQRRWATELLVELMRVSPESWKQYQSLLQICIMPSNRDHLPALLDQLEFSTVPELARELARRINREFNLEVDGDDPVKVASALRRQLGITRTPTGKEASGVWNRLASRSQTDLLVDPSTRSDEEMQDVMLKLLFWGNQAAALALRPEDSEVVQKNLTNGPPELEAASDSTVTPTTAPPTDRRNLDRLVGRLTNLNNVSTASAISTIRAVGEQLSSGVDLSDKSNEAQALARFLLIARPANEQKRLLAIIDPLKNWSPLLLALADELDQPGTSLNQGVAVVSTLLNLDLILDGGEGGSDSMRRKLLERAITQLSSSRTRGEGSSSWTRLQQNCVAEIEKRRVLFDPTPGPSKPRLPGEAMVDLTRAFYHWAVDHSPTLEGKPPYQDCLNTLEASAYLSDANDLQRTVAAQQILLQLLQLWIEVNHVPLSPQVKVIHEDYRENATRRMDVVSQIIDGEQAWLKSWLLLRQ